MTMGPFPIWRMKHRNRIILQKNGEGDLVVMSIEAFEKREEMIRLRAKLELAEQSRLEEPAILWRL